MFVLDICHKTRATEGADVVQGVSGLIIFIADELLLLLLLIGNDFTSECFSIIHFPLDEDRKNVKGIGIFRLDQEIQMHCGLLSYKTPINTSSTG